MEVPENAFATERDLHIFEMYLYPIVNLSEVRSIYVCTFIFFLILLYKNCIGYLNV